MATDDRAPLTYSGPVALLPDGTPLTYYQRPCVRVTVRTGSEPGREVTDPQELLELRAGCSAWRVKVAGRFRPDGAADLEFVRHSGGGQFQPMRAQIPMGG